MPEERRPGTCPRPADSDVGDDASSAEERKVDESVGQPSGAAAAAPGIARTAAAGEVGRPLDMRIERRGLHEPVVDESGQDPTPRGDKAGCQGGRGRKGTRGRNEDECGPAPVAGGTEADGAPGAETKTTDLAAAPASSPCGPTGPAPSTSSQPTCTRPWGGWTRAGKIGQEVELEPGSDSSGGRSRSSPNRRTTSSASRLPRHDTD